MKEVQDIKDINNNSIVGVIFPEGDKVLILKAIKSLPKGKYYGIGKTDSTFKDDSQWYAKSKRQYVKMAQTEQPGSKAFVFDTFGEACKWLVK